LEKVQGGNGHIPGCDKALGELLRGEVADLEGANNWAGDPLLRDLGLCHGDAQQGTQIAEARELDEDIAEVKEK
jgi:hypothetical protein